MSQKLTASALVTSLRYQVPKTFPYTLLTVLTSIGILLQKYYSNYATFMPDAPDIVLCSKLCRHNPTDPSINIHSACMLPQCFPVLPYGNWAHLNENPRMWAVAKVLRAPASEHSSNFWEHSEQRPNFSSTPGNDHVSCFFHDDCNSLKTLKHMIYQTFSLKLSKYIGQNTL